MEIVHVVKTGIVLPCTHPVARPDPVIIIQGDSRAERLLPMAAISINQSSLTSSTGFPPSTMICSSILLLVSPYSTRLYVTMRASFMSISKNRTRRW